MLKRGVITLVVLITAVLTSCNHPYGVENTAYPSGVNPELADFIKNIKAVDNHAHPNTMDANDKGSDALPLVGLGDIELPVRVRPESPQWVAASKALYSFTGSKLDNAGMQFITNAAADARTQKGDKFPAWALDKAGIEVMLGNRIFMGRLKPPRFRWTAYVDALLFPLSTKTEAAETPDRKLLFPLESQLMTRFLTDLKLTKLPPTLDEYLNNVVSPTLQSMKNGGCLALKYEAAYLRSLDFEKVGLKPASDVYARYINGGEPANDQYKLLQDYLFRYIALQAGKLGMAIHVHSFPAAGNYFVAKDCDPLLMEPVLNDPDLRKTNFVIIHGGGTFWQHTSAMLWKPNFYTDISLMTLLWEPSRIAVPLRDWLSQFPEKVLFGTDGVSFGPGMGWELSTWISSQTARQALSMALSGMVADKEISLDRAKEIAVMVMRTNAAKLYHLKLNDQIKLP